MDAYTHEQQRAAIHTPGVWTISTHLANEPGGFFLSLPFLFFFFILLSFFSCDNQKDRISRRLISSLFIPERPPPLRRAARRPTAEE